VILAADLVIAGMGSLALVILELRKAPEGYEDERGFHPVRKRTAWYGVSGSRIRRIRKALSVRRLAIKSDCIAIP
jgi:hypothetical protein